MYIQRKIDIQEKLKQKSYFLFGPRQTGKTSLIKQTLSGFRTYNLLDHDVFLKLSQSPKRLRQEITADEKIVIIDEIQKLPVLLDEVHYLIEEKGIHFLLTGSSARKLRRGGVNLLGGRARVQHLGPFVSAELDTQFDLMKAVNDGLLPSIYFSGQPQEDLRTYVGTYLQEEIAAEGLTRNIPAFSRFLEVAALCNGQLINYTKIANDAQVARSTVQEYFGILKDTLIAFEVLPWKKTIKRKPLSTSKMFFFDAGVARLLQHRGVVSERTPEFGELFETVIAHELRTYCDYVEGELYYWRSASGYEVDFILSDKIAIEVKASKNVSSSDLKGLRALSEEVDFKRRIVVSLEETARIVDGIEILPWQDFLKFLWGGRHAE